MRWEWLQEKKEKRGCDRMREWRLMERLSGESLYSANSRLPSKLDLINKSSISTLAKKQILLQMVQHHVSHGKYYPVWSHQRADISTIISVSWFMQWQTHLGNSDCIYCQKMDFFQWSRSLRCFSFSDTAAGVSISNESIISERENVITHDRS